MNLKILFWLIVATTLGVYGTMLFWSLPRLSADAGGLLLFDLRPLGYSFAEAKILLEALSPEGIRFYRHTQQLLDSFFPLLAAISIGWACYQLAPFAWRKMRFGFLILVLPGMVFDYLENAAVAKMLDRGADNLNEALVSKASGFSQLKAIFVSLEMLVLLGLIALWFFRRSKAGAAR